LTAAAAPLALLISALLFLQWPLRDGIGAYATQANDLAQWLFAFYVAVAVTHAQRRGVHLVARPDIAARASRLRRAGAALCVLPWALFLLWTAAPAVWQSLSQWERFPETLNPGYFMIKLALLLLALLMAWQSVRELLRLRH
jgi:TRAP-type mannitol/chloroaromatic compound transport system permease small subunit